MTASYQPQRLWTEEELRRIVDLRASGLSWPQVGESMGRTADSVRRAPIHRLTVSSPIQAVVAEQMAAAAGKPTFAQRLAALEEENATLRQQLNPQRLPVEQEAVAEFRSVADYWRQCEEQATADIARSREKHRFRVVLDDDIIAVAFVSDQHIGPGTPVDFRRMREDAELIAATPGLYGILGGDLCDNHIKHRAPAMAARSQPSDQWRLAEHYLSIFADKIIVTVSGNHDDWTDEIAGISALGIVCEKQRVCCASDEARIDVAVGGEVYRVAMRHQYKMNSSFNQTHSVLQWLRLGEDEFDIGAVGHHHEAAVSQNVYRGHPVVCIRPGSYQITSAYSRRYGFNRSIPTCPSVLLWPRQRRMMAFWDVRDAAEVLGHLRAGRKTSAVFTKPPAIRNIA